MRCTERDLCPRNFHSEFIYTLPDIDSTNSEASGSRI